VADDEQAPVQVVVDGHEQEVARKHVQALHTRRGRAAQGPLLLQIIGMQQSSSLTSQRPLGMTADQACCRILSYDA
jgi:hypothetical protein